MLSRAVEVIRGIGNSREKNSKYMDGLFEVWNIHEDNRNKIFRISYNSSACKYSSYSAPLIGQRWAVLSSDWPTLNTEANHSIRHRGEEWGEPEPTQWR